MNATRTTLHEETYLDHRVEVILSHTPESTDTWISSFDGKEHSSTVYESTYIYVAVNGRTWHSARLQYSPEQQDALVKKLVSKGRQDVDLTLADDAIRSIVTPLIHNADFIDQVIWTNRKAKAVGDTAYVYAMGYYRRGIITKIARTGKPTVAYTTASSNGRIYRKAQDLKVEANQ